MLVRSDEHEAQVLEMCRRLNIRVDRRGLAWHVYGHGVDITTTTLSMIQERDLMPAPRGTTRS